MAGAVLTTILVLVLVSVLVNHTGSTLLMMAVTPAVPSAVVLDGDGDGIWTE
jgi:hypothetical protein